MVLFSIVIPVYNTEKYLDYCLQSILKQSYSSYEIILVDDGSKDKSGKICDNYKKKYPDILSVIHQENKGQFLSRTAGIQIATGEFIFCVDSDDAIAEGTLDFLQKKITKYNLDVILFDFVHMYANNNIKKEQKKSIFPEGMVTKEDVFEKIISSSEINSLCTKVCRRSLFHNQVKINENYSDIRQGEDLLQLLPIIANANKMYYTHHSFYQYRINIKSVVHTPDINTIKSLLTVRPTLYQYLCELNYDTNENITAFYNFYLSCIWLALYRILQNDLRTSQTFHLFRVISKNQFVQTAGNYLLNTKIPIYERIPLKFFFSRRYKALYFILKLEWIYLRSKLVINEIFTHK